MKTRVPGEPRDFVDCYLDELDKVCVYVTVELVHWSHSKALSYLLFIKTYLLHSFVIGVLIESGVHSSLLLLPQSHLSEKRK